MPPQPLRPATALLAAGLAALALPACQKSDLRDGAADVAGPDKALALDLEGRWVIGAFYEDGEDLVGGEDAVYDYAALDFDYEGGGGGGLEVSLASATARVHLDGTYAADAARAAIAFDGEASYAYGASSELVEPLAAEFAIARESPDALTLTGVVAGSPWSIHAVRD